MRISPISISVSIFVIVFLAIIFVAGYSNMERSTKLHKKFNEAIIHARIRHIDQPSRGLSYIYFYNDTNVYVASIYANDEMDDIKYGFDHFAQMGDSVVKELNSSSLFLFKKDKIYKYRIGR